jgi:hypothetical protein
VKANTDLAMINHARVAELSLIQQIHDLISPAGQIDFTAAKDGVNSTSGLGITRKLIVALSNAAAYERRLYRLKANAPMRAILPNWVGDAMVADIASQMPGDGLDALFISEEKVMSLFKARGINVTFALDDWTETGGVGPAPTVAGGGFESSVSFPLFPEGSYLFLDGGTLDLGVTRDGAMLAANEYATFVETFEAVAKTGCAGLWVTTDVCVSGAAAALVETACA